MINFIKLWKLKRLIVRDPKGWRERWSNEVILIEFEDRIEILAKGKPKLSQFFDVEDVEMEILEDLLRDSWMPSLRRYKAQGNGQQEDP